MKKTELTSEQYAALGAAKKRFEAWRETKTGRARIPDSLWNMAEDLFHTWGLSINKIVRTLKLSHSTLKKKILQEPAVSIKPVDNPTTDFIELRTAPVDSQCIIEMENRSGIKMRMCFSGSADPAVINLGRYFLDGQP